MDATLVMGSVVTLSERGRTVFAREWLGASVQQQVRLEAAAVTEGFAADETDVVTANQTLAHKHVVEVTIVTEDTVLTIFASKNCFSRVNIDVSHQRLERCKNRSAFWTRWEQVAFTCHVLI